MHGGIGDYTARLVDALADNGWDARVLTSSSVQSDDQRVLARIPRWNWEIQRQVQVAVDESRSTVIHVQYQTGAFGMHPAINFLPRRFNGIHTRIPFVTTFHDLLPPYLFPKAGPIRSWVTRSLAGSSDAIIVTNARDLECLAIQRRLRRKVTMIPIGSNLSDIADIDSEVVRGKIGLTDPHEFAIGFFGFLTEDKGVDILLSALAERTWSESTALVIIGGGLAATDISNRQYLEWIKRQLIECPVRMIETGFLPPADAAATLRAMDVVVLPFRHGASLRRGTLVAAIRAGATVLTTDPESDESLAPLVGGETMWLVPPGEPDALQAGLSTLLGDRLLRLRLASNARIRGAEFDWNTIAQRHISLYEDLLKRSGRVDGAN